VRISGGGARSLFWRRLLADILGKPVVTLETQEGSAYGAALLALVGTGEFATVPEVCRVAIREVERVEPDAGRASAYAERHSIYQSLYPALQSFYRSVATM
jgi:xylulokinase